MAPTITCLNCQRRFKAHRSTRRTCSDRCRKAIERTRTRERRLASGLPLGGYEEMILERKVSDDLNGRRRREPDPHSEGSRGSLSPGISIIETGRPCGGLLFPVVSDAEIRLQRAAVSAEDSHLRWEPRELPPMTVQDDRPEHVREEAAETLMLLIRVEMLGGLAHSLPFLVNEPDACGEFELEPDVLRELLDIHERAQALYKPLRPHSLLEERHRRRRLPQAQANLRWGERQHLAARIHEWAVLTVTRTTTSRREVSMSTTIPTDERLARDALRLVELQTEIGEIAERLAQRFPGRADVLQAVERFFEQAQKPQIA